MRGVNEPFYLLETCIGSASEQGPVTPPVHCFQPFMLRVRCCEAPSELLCALAFMARMLV